MLGASDPSRQKGRLRWATQRVPTHEEAQQKRHSIMRAFSKRQHAAEKSKDTEGQSNGVPPAPSDNTEETQVDDLQGQRRIFINQPLPPSALDEDGSPLQYFARNKIRTAKYTPLIFVPKNLWLQFHNVANVYFLFVTILAVRYIPIPRYLRHGCGN